jgi:hypothetical protein
MCVHVEGLYWRKPTQCLASSEILAPLRPASVYPPPLVQGEDTLAGWSWGRGSIVRKTSDTALYTIYVSTFCVYTMSTNIFFKVIKHRRQNIFPTSQGTITVEKENNSRVHTYPLNLHKYWIGYICRWTNNTGAIEQIIDIAATFTIAFLEQETSKTTFINVFALIVLLLAWE